MQSAVAAVVTSILIGVTGCTIDRIGKVAPDAGPGDRGDAGGDLDPGDAGEPEPECRVPSDCVMAVYWDCCGACEMAMNRTEMHSDACILPIGDVPPESCQYHDCDECPVRGACRAGLYATCIEGECAAIEGPPPADTAPPTEPQKEPGHDGGDDSSGDPGGGGEW